MQISQIDNRPTIGFFTQGIDFNVGFECYAGVLQKCEELDLNLICVVHEPATEQNSDATLKHHNLFFQKFPKMINGLICGITPSNLGMSVDDLNKLLDYYQMPSVSISPLGKIPYICFDDYEGMRTVLQHLIKDHHLKRIFYLRGPKNHDVAKERYCAFRDLMLEYDCYDPKLISPPLNWNPKQEKLTIAQVLGNLQIGKDFDAIAAVNDFWAMECIEKLQKQGVLIPEELAVVGINDSFHGQNCDVPLTSVAYPFYDQGCRITEKLAHLLQGKHVNGSYLPTQLIVRRSCGCADPEIAAVIRDGITDGYPDIDETDFLDREWLVNQIVRYFSARKEKTVKKVIEEITQAFLLDLETQNGNANNFLLALNKNLKADLASSGRAEPWQKALSLLRQVMLKHNSETNRTKIEDLCQQARELIGNTMLHHLENQFIKKKDQTRVMNQLQAEMSHVFNRYEMINLLAEYLPKIGFTSWECLINCVNGIIS